MLGMKWNSYGQQFYQYQHTTDAVPRNKNKNFHVLISNVNLIKIIC
jgi:hypothetical protein